MFEHIIGNEKIKKELINSLKLNKISHSYIFLGTDGIGKKLFAREFAKAILCENTEYCDKCKSCIEFNSKNNPDYGEIIPDGNSIKIDQIREMQLKVSEPPIISSKKVYLIDDAHLMTKEAQNAMLKTLEEPPHYATIILLGANESNFLSTIKSRCISIKFTNITNNEIVEYLKETKGLNNISQSILEAAEGSIGKVERLQENETLYLAIDNIVNNIEKLDLISTLKNADLIYKSQNEQNEILDYINLRMLEKARKDLRFLNCINIVENAKLRLKSNSNYNMTIDNMIISIWEELH